MARVFRSSPQFGVTLLSYELLYSFFASGNALPKPPTNAPVTVEDFSVMTGEMIGHKVDRISRKMGEVLPRFSN